MLRVGFVLHFLSVEIHSSARKHGIPDDDIVHAVEHVLAWVDLDEDSPQRILIIGPDRSGTLLEVVTLTFDNGRDLAIHAMQLRSKYHPLLNGIENP